MLEVRFHEREQVEDEFFKYAVMMTKYKGKWIFVRHQSRDTWEIPGGRREIGETILQTAHRELIEETGAISYKLAPICPYSVIREENESYGYLFLAEIEQLSPSLEHEISEVKVFENLPEKLTYPLIQPLLFDKTIEHLKRK